MYKTDHLNLKENFFDYCENCKSSNFLKFPGIGIEKIEEEINKQKNIVSEEELKKKPQRRKL